MNIHDHADEFGGPPVADLPAPPHPKATRADNAAAENTARRLPSEPDQVAWALRTVGWGRGTEGFAAAPTGAPIVTRRRELDLSLGTFGDRGAEALWAGRPLNHPRALNLEHTFLSTPVAERLEASPVGVAVDTADRDEGGRRGRYAAVAE
ncbi:hypothetical protein LO772_06660 [Yinghuangia sp. ASG 101]|uniref:hypothetical protein n=1 Tax=Yinghuangia sp. ASG 101 TaxID=2896848 RepID=UPI001E59B731|nr:hypothetical protein [Yinghuangia sp. ASG 101]UGQ13292.1 hypothetical protein LO772_06660 [Yinghuangia sp. ASG 101]